MDYPLTPQERVCKQVDELLMAELDADLQEVVKGIDWRKITMLDTLVTIQRLRMGKRLLAKQLQD